MQELIKTLTAEFHDKEYAHAYIEDFSNMAIAAQIKSLREQRGWTQKELADISNMKQERICALEDVDYDAWTIKTLRKLSKAFDLTIKFSFEKFSDGILDISKINNESLKRTSRQEDLSEFSCNEFGAKEFFFSEPVITMKPSLSLVQTNTMPINDMEYFELTKKIA